MSQVSTFSATSWVDENGTHINDISLSSGQIAMATGKDAYRTAIECAIRTRLGELPLDIEQGIPYFETVFQSSRLVSDFEAALRARIEEFTFVDEVEEISTNFDRARSVLSYSVTVSTTDGGEIVAEDSFGAS